MATITAQQVNDLRKATNAGMMDCKNALVEANGDFETAIDILRKKGQKIAAKREDRDANEGVILAKTAEDAKFGVVVCLNCETDFVAKNESFIGLVETITNIALKNKINTPEELLSLGFDSDMTIKDKLIEQTGVIGEKLEISKAFSLSGERVVAYNHPGNRLATLVSLNKSDVTFDEPARQVAMQVAAMNPIALDKDGVSQEIIDREIEIGKELAINEGKPAEMAEKIAQGRLGKFFKENTLLSQEFIRDNKLTVEQFLKTVDKDLTATGFQRIGLGN
ncbi:MAG: translation elongation factor Ts [Flavobacteriales bacterium]